MQNRGMSEAVLLKRIRQLARTGAARMIRVSAGLSLAELGESMDPPVPASTVLRWERGECAPHGARALAYARILKELTQGEDGA